MTWAARSRLVAAAAMAAFGFLAVVSVANAVPAPGQTGLPLPVGGYVVDEWSDVAIDLRNDQRLVVRPRLIRIKATTDGGSTLFTELRWTGWGTRRASATGEVSSCDYRGNGCVGYGVVRLRLESRRSYGCEASRRSVRIYQRFAYTASGLPWTSYRLMPSVYC